MMRLYRIAYPVINDENTVQHEYIVDDFDPPEPRAIIKFIEWPSLPGRPCFVTWAVPDSESERSNAG